MEIFKPTIQDQATFSGSVDISGSLTITQNLNVVGELQGAATTASYISLANVDGFTDVSSSIEQRISSQESFSQSLDNTFATDQQVADAVSSLNAATSSYALEANISGSFTSVSESLAGRITSNESSVSALNLASSSYLLNTTDTLTGTLTVTNVVDASSVTIADAVTHKTDTHTRLEFASDQIKLNTSGSTRVNITNSGVDIFDGLDMNSTKITQVQDPTSAQDAATKNYVDTSVSSLNSVTSSYLLNTTDTLDGDLTVTGKITAQEFHTEFVSASILYDSGSTKFGNDTGDIHSFTGSLRVYDDIQVNGTVPLKLIVNGGAANDATEFRNGNGEFKIYSGRTSGGQHQSFVFASGDNYTSGANRMIISGSNGYVGIGTASPAYLLDVNGSMRADSYRIGGGTVLSGLTTVYLGSGGATSTIGLVTTSGQGLTLNGGNVGIGTTSPSSPLHIDGGTASEVLKVEADSSPYIRWIQNGTNVGFLQFSSSTAYLSNMSNGKFIFRTNNTDQMAITATGNVGMGTISPDSKLHLQSASATGAIINLESTHTGGIPIYNLKGAHSAQLRYQDENGNNQSRIDFLDAGEMSFIDAANGTTRMKIGSNGHIGLGTTVPGYRLTVYNDGDTYSADFYQANSGTDKYNAIRVRGAMTTAVGYYGIAGSTASNPSFRDSFVVGTQSAHTFNLATSDTARLTIDSGGNVGIGTTSPTSKLHIETGTGDEVTNFTVNTAGTVTISRNHALAPNITTSFGSGRANIDLTTNSVLTTKISTGDSYFIGGNIGIGQTSPANFLHIGSNTTGNNYPAVLVQSVTGYLPAIMLARGDGSFSSTGNSNWLIANSDNGFEISLADNLLTSTTSRDTAFQIDSSGNVGIGTTSPAAKLQVKGSTAGATVLDIQGTSGQLFSVTDDLTGTLFSVADISGIPIFEVEADGVINVDGDVQNSQLYKSNQWNWFTTPMHYYVATTANNMVTVDVTSDFTLNGNTALPANTKAIYVTYYYHISGYSIGSGGQGDHANDIWGPDYPSSTTSWSFTTNGNYTWGSAMFMHDGDSSVASGNPGFFGYWYPGAIIPVNSSNQTIRGYLSHGYSGGTHYHHMYVWGYST